MAGSGEGRSTSLCCQLQGHRQSAEHLYTGKKQLESHECLHATAWKKCADTLSLFPIFSLSGIKVGVFLLLHHPQASEGGMLCNGCSYKGKLSHGTGGQGPSPRFAEGGWQRAASKSSSTITLWLKNAPPNGGLGAVG